MFLQSDRYNLSVIQSISLLLCLVLAPLQIWAKPVPAIEAFLRFRPVTFQLQPTDKAQMQVTIDAQDVAGPAQKKGGGVSFHLLTSGPARLPYGLDGKLQLNKNQIKTLKALKLPMTRVYGMAATHYGTNKLGYSLEGAIDRFKELSDLLDIPQETMVLEFEVAKPDIPLSVETWVRGIKYAKRQGYQFRFWEIGNETYTKNGKIAYPEPQVYIDHFIKVSKAIKAIAPEDYVGISIYRARFKPQYRENVLKQAAGYYDFVVAHHYNFGKIHEINYSEAVLSENYYTLDNILKINELIKQYNPIRQVFQYDTEWGNHDRGPDKGKAGNVKYNGNVIGAMHRIVRMIHYARGGYLEGASSWVMYGRTPEIMGFGVVPAFDDKKTTMLYQVYYYMNRYVGDQLLNWTGTCPYYASTQKKLKHNTGPMVPFLATQSQDGKHMYLVMVNGDWEQDLPCDIQLKHFQIKNVKATLLSHDDREAEPVITSPKEFVSPFKVNVEKSSHLSFVLPGHSAVFIELQSK